MCVLWVKGGAGVAARAESSGTFVATLLLVSIMVVLGTATLVAALISSLVLSAVLVVALILVGIVLALAGTHAAALISSFSRGRLWMPMVRLVLVVTLLLVVSLPMVVLLMVVVVALLVLLHKCGSIVAKPTRQAVAGDRECLGDALAASTKRSTQPNASKELSRVVWETRLLHGLHAVRWHCTIDVLALADALLALRGIGVGRQERSLVRARARDLERHARDRAPYRVGSLEAAAVLG